MAWNAWGDPPPPSHSRTGSATCCSRPSASRPPTPSHPASTTSSCPRAGRPHRDALASIVGAGYLRTDHLDRILHAGGKSTLDLLRRKQIRQDSPDAVLLPATEDEIARILAYCSEHAIAVVPFGGGTSVVGGLDPIRGRFGAVVTLDLRRLDALHWLDEVSGEAELGAGVTGPDAERLLGERGFSLGHFPQSFRFATIGGFAATRSSGRTPPATGGSTT